MANLLKLMVMLLDSGNESLGDWHNYANQCAGTPTRNVHTLAHTAHIFDSGHTGSIGNVLYVFVFKRLGCGKDFKYNWVIFLVLLREDMYRADLVCLFIQRTSLFCMHVSEKETDENMHDTTNQTPTTVLLPCFCYLLQLHPSSGYLFLYLPSLQRYYWWCRCVCDVLSPTLSNLPTYPTPLSV